MTNYQLKDAVIDKNAEDIQAHLHRSYEAKFRPLCMCKASGVAMYIAKIGNSFVIKRMPNTGQKHHPNCDSFEIPPELTGRSGLQDSAIAEDQSTGLTNLKFEFSLSKIGGSRAVPTQSTEKKTEIKADPSKLTLLSLLHCLYEDAGFNRWSPNMLAKRRWGTIQRYLTKAAQSKVARKNPLSDILHIPETFSMERKDALAAQRRKFLSKFRSKGKTSPLGICIGEVKELIEARFNHKLVMKHMADMPLYFDEDLNAKLQKTFSRELAMHRENEHIHLLAICTFRVSASGNPTIDALSFMMVDANWLPFESLEELDVITKAVAGNRHFIKGLRYNLRPSKVIASVLFTDTGEDPITYYVVPAGAGDSYYEELERVIEESEFRSSFYDVNNDDQIDLPLDNSPNRKVQVTHVDGERNEDVLSSYRSEPPPIDVGGSSHNGAGHPPGPAQVQGIVSPNQTMVLEQPQASRSFGRYEVVRALGRGAMGQVYLCRDPLISRDVAIKCMEYKRFAAGEVDRIKARFLKEAEAAGRLNHPDIVSIFDMGEDENCSYIAMDYVNGKTLEEHISRDALLPINEVFRIAERIATALDYAHSKGVVHRDIKPSNIMYCKDPFLVKITDFGVAKITDNTQTKVGSIIGSPLYMAPEQIRGEQVTGGCDIYSLGVTIYQLLCGELPFKVDNLPSLTFNIINTEPPDVSEVKPDLPSIARDITRKALQKDPKERYLSGKAMADDLRLAIQNQEIA